MRKGSSVKVPLLKKSHTYRNLLVENFDCLYESSGFRSGWDRAKYLVDFCKENSLQQRGHYLTSGKFPDRGEVRGILSNFLDSGIDEWDCVLEPLQNNGRLYCDEQAVWDCFLEAKSLSPKSKLFLCDYFRTNAKWEGLYSFLAKSVSRKIPIDGVAVQLHSNLRPPFLNHSPLTLNWKMCLYWMRRLSEDFDITLQSPETVVWQPQERITKSELDELKKHSNINKEIGLHLVGKTLPLWGVDDLQFQGYKTLIQISALAGCDLCGFWSAFDAAPWNWYLNREKAGLWDDHFRPKKAATVLELPCWQSPQD